MRKTHAAFLFCRVVNLLSEDSEKRSRQNRKILPTNLENSPDDFFDRFQRYGVGAKRKQGAALQMAMRLLDVMCASQKGIRWTECPIR